MKKKFFAFLLCFATVWSEISAQEAFKNLAIGLEASTAGFGLELATPLSSNFALRGGFSILPYNYNTILEGIVNQDIKTKLDGALSADQEITDDLRQKGLPTTASAISTDINTTASLGLANGKILLDYYPIANYSFHFTAGFYIGSNKLLKVKGRMDEVVEVLTVLKDHGHDFFNETYIIDESNGYQLSGKDVMDVRGSLKTNAVKPYFGFGFGSAVPKKRVGVSFEIGAFYHGTPKIKSENENIQKLIDNELADVSEILKKIPVYPVLSLKLNFKAF